MTVPTIYTIGHSTRSTDELVALLSDAGVRELVDVRSAPRSRRYPHLRAGALARSLGQSGIHYRHDAALADASAAPRCCSPNEAWSDESFRGYADYMTSGRFERALSRLEARALEQRACLMCAEAHWRSCHRRLICDALLIRGWRVLHLGLSNRPHHHVLTPFAVIGAGHRITYPPVSRV
jgi:uncharacterized protein (DUF488 family)